MKTLLFDFDGTLADSADVMMKCANQLADKYDYGRLSDWTHFRNKTTKQIFKEELGIAWYRVPFFISEGRKVFRSYYDEISLFEGIKEMLETLSTHFNVYVVSSNSPETVTRILNRYGINCFKGIEGDIGLSGKTKRIKMLMKRDGLNSSDLIYIGDELRDFESARKIDVRFIGVSWGLHSPEMMQNHGVNEIVHSAEELTQVLIKDE